MKLYLLKEFKLYLIKLKVFNIAQYCYQTFLLYCTYSVDNSTTQLILLYSTPPSCSLLLLLVSLLYNPNSISEDT